MAVFNSIVQTITQTVNLGDQDTFITIPGITANQRVFLTNFAITTDQPLTADGLFFTLGISSDNVGTTKRFINCYCVGGGNTRKINTDVINVITTDNPVIFNPTNFPFFWVQTNQVAAATADFSISYRVLPDRALSTSSNNTIGNTSTFIANPFALPMNVHSLYVGSRSASISCTISKRDTTALINVPLATNPTIDGNTVQLLPAPTILNPGESILIAVNAFDPDTFFNFAGTQLG